MYRLTPFGKTRRGVAGFPWRRELTDSEYQDAERAYAEAFVGIVEDEGERTKRENAARKDFRDQGYFEHVTREEIEAEEPVTEPDSNSGPPAGGGRRR